MKPPRHDPTHEGLVRDPDSGEVHWQWATMAPMLPWRLRLLAYAVPMAVGAALYYLLSAKEGRAAASYAGGLGLTAFLLIMGMLAVRAGAARSPVLATAMALLTYTYVALVLAATLAVSDPHTVDEPALALGLVVGVVVGVALQIREARPGLRR
jgi:peptidoglycan/LPS O-acetylase OafA/YrhL